METDGFKIKEQTLEKELRTGFELLLGLVERGSEDAAELLSQCLIDILAKFLETCDKKPELFCAAAEKRSIWPAVTTLDPNSTARYRHYDPDWIRQQVHLGERTGLKYKGKLAGSALGSQIARKLFAIIAIWRRTAPPVEIHLPKKLPKLVFEESSGEDRCEFTQMESALAHAWSKRLPVLNRSKDVLEEWWKCVMKPLFVKLYGSSFEDHKAFTHYWENARNPNLSHKDAAKYAKDYQKRIEIRRRVLNDVRQSLRSIAAKHP